MIVFKHYLNINYFVIRETNRFKKANDEFIRVDQKLFDIDYYLFAVVKVYMINYF